MSNAKIPNRRSRWDFGFRHWDFQRKTFGFTLVEVVVMMMIVVTISGVVLVSFTGLHEGVATNRAARELALAIRRMQNVSLAVTQVNTLAGPRTPGAVGMRLETGSPRYTLFADIVRDNKYDAVVVAGQSDAKISEGVLEGGVAITGLSYENEFGRSQTVETAHVIFTAPEAAMTVSDRNGETLGEVLQIVLSRSSGRLAKTVTVRTSGQVSIK